MSDDDTNPSSLGNPTKRDFNGVLNELRIRALGDFLANWETLNGAVTDEDIEKRLNA
jgi:hypothetical protein